MKNLIYSLFICLLFSSCGQELRDTRTTTGKTTSNQFDNGASTGGPNTVCTAQYQPVCGAVPCPQGAQCFVPPTPTTYSNSCEMNKAGATLISNGACP